MLRRPVVEIAPTEDDIVPPRLVDHLARQLPHVETVSVSGSHDWIMENCRSGMASLTRSTPERALRSRAPRSFVRGHAERATGSWKAHAEPAIGARPRSPRPAPYSVISLLFSFPASELDGIDVCAHANE
jgi:hypothetical protein